MSIWEVVMLCCFGVSWPISITKSLRTKVVAGKSPVFMIIIIIGYLCGIVHKLLFSPDWVTGLYAFNAALVGFDLFLYFRYLPRKATV
ncbi:MAG: hypothetical protein CSA95_02270 [Bacteroidetes bacterium]|nr:MAG: hypothetical protein CSA95_02270 [Bacteroidota bacterium]